MARKESNIHYIYKTTCNVTGRYYVGMHSTCNLEDGYMGSGLRLRRSIRKYGKNNHIKEILQFFENRYLLIEAEKKAITQDMITDKNCMNLKKGGDGGWNEKHNKAFKNKLLNDDEFKDFFSNLKREHGLNRFKTNNLQLITKRCDWTNKNHSEETKKLMSEVKKGIGTGETNSQYGTCWITKNGLNKKIKKEDLEVYLNEGWIQGRK